MKNLSLVIEKIKARVFKKIYVCTIDSGAVYP